jgi:hypothetical protein
VIERSVSRWLSSSPLGFSPRALKCEHPPLFAARRQVSLSGVLLPRDATALAHTFTRRRFDRVSQHPHAISRGIPSSMYYEADLPAHRVCFLRCAPCCAFMRSIRTGDLAKLLAAVTGQRDLSMTSARLYAYVKGSHVTRRLAGRPSIEVLWCGTREWESSWGGALRFGEQELLPRFGSLHVVEQNPGDVSSVDLVKEHGPLFVAAFSFERMA